MSERLQDIFGAVTGVLFGSAVAYVGPDLAGLAVGAMGLAMGCRACGEYSEPAPTQAERKKVAPTPPPPA